MKFGLKKSVVDKMGIVFEQYTAIEKVTLYGSRAMGDHRNGSDIDLVIYGNLSSRDFYDVLHALDELMLPYTIDICQIDSIKSPNLIDHINRIGLPFYERHKVLQ